MPLLVEQVNEAIRDKTRHIDAIAKGYDQPSYHVRVEVLESDKAKLNNLILDAEMKKEPVTVSVQKPETAIWLLR